MSISKVIFTVFVVIMVHNVPLFRLNPLAAGLNLNQGLKADASKEMEEAMRRVREAQSLISAAIEPGRECTQVLKDLLPVSEFFHS